MAMIPKSLDTIVVGLGATGLSVAKYLQQQQHDFAVVDNYGDAQQVQALHAIDKNIPLAVGDFDAAYLSKAKRLVVNPGIAVHSPAIVVAAQSGSEVMGDIELFANAVPSHAKVVAVTGSNGKSTCVTMLHAMAEQAGILVKLGGNIGVPALDLLTAETELYILELSSYQLETTNSLHCEVAAVLNLTPDHLDRYDSYQSYCQAKKKLAKQTKTLVLDLDDEILQSWGLEAIGFGLQAPQKPKDFGLRDHQGEAWLAQGETLLIPVSDLALQGLHHARNALAALAMGAELGLPIEAMCAALRTVEGLAHRTEVVAVVQGVTWINDSKATNVGATVAAIQGLMKTEPQIILLAGGQTKGADLLPLVAAAKTGVKFVYVFGEDAPLLWEVLHPVIACEIVSDLATACAAAKAQSVKGDVVLLSPAGASFDSYVNFEARGDAFVEWVRAAA